MSAPRSSAAAAPDVPPSVVKAGADASSDAAWLAGFHRGERGALARCYADGFSAVDAAVAVYVRGADRETVVHEVFAKLIADESARRSFTGGSLRAWLATLGRNRAIDFLRRRKREELVDPQAAADIAGAVDHAGAGTDADARRVVDRFRQEGLPEKWRAVFEARFVNDLSQREAARALGISRTTLAYQEMRVRALLKRFVDVVELDAAGDDAEDDQAPERGP